MYDSLKILFVEDNETDVRLMVQMLKKEFETVSYRQVNDADALLRALEDERWDIIVTDYSMPEFSGEEVLEIHRSLGLNMPVILKSVAVGEEIAVEMMKAGANDYILKDNLPRLIPAITRELEDYRIRLERKRIQNELTESQHRYQTLVDMSPDGICMLDTRFITLLANPRKAVLFGYETPEEMVGLNALSMIAEGYREDLLTNMPNYLENGLIDCMEVEFLRKDGSKFWGELRCKVIKDDYGKKHWWRANHGSAALMKTPLSEWNY